MVRIAVAQGLGTQRFDAASIAAQGREVRELMRVAAAGSARLVLFTEGALSGYPHKRLISSDRAQVADADWALVAWDVLARELELTAQLAGELELWTVVGSVHPSSEGGRPSNSLHVISDAGVIVDRYDKRYLSTTESSFLYAAGTRPTTFEVEGLRFGCALCIEAGLPEVFIEYEAMGADCVLLASYSTDPDSLDEQRPLAHALLTQMWIAFAAPGLEPGHPRSGVASADARWLARGAEDGAPQVVLADLDPSHEAAQTGYRYGRPWRARHRAASAVAPDSVCPPGAEHRGAHRSRGRPAEH
ncbi:carbon-nitrogen hydrolase family protein [Brachybacterium sp. GCM10030267]|uniref:carbon-nitrogen hydrolase family protein n=1 Tax=Brachybacterium sp. GCM10030267 TaxID=3273381 RepID=UPI00361E50E5